MLHWNNTRYTGGMQTVISLMLFISLLGFTADKLAVKGKEIFVLQAIFHLKAFKFHTLIIL